MDMFEKILAEKLKARFEQAYKSTGAKTEKQKREVEYAIGMRAGGISVALPDFNKKKKTKRKAKKSKRVNK